MSRFGNIDRVISQHPALDSGSKCIRRIVTTSLLLMILTQAAWSQSKSKSAPKVRTDEQGRKFINSIPLDVFFEDPLEVASNKKEVEGSSTASQPSSTASASPTPPAKTESSQSTGGIDWKDLIPIEELQGEVKAIRNSLTKLMTNQGSYKSNFKEVAIEGAEIAALAAILQSHSESLTWKDKAQYVRDFGAQLNQAATGLSKENFDNSKAAFQRLTSVLDGSIPNDAGDVPETRPFNEAANRKELMKRIERAKNYLQQDVNSEAKFKSLADQTRREAAIIASLGTVITTAGYEYTSDDEYQKHAQSLIGGAKEAAAALQDDSFDRFKQAVDKVNKSCTDCHQSYGTQ